MGTGDLSLACVSLLVDELIRGGVRHACISPGSRSTPIALALERDPRVTVHVHLDERASAFFALGIAKPSEPVVVACTSGTAASELFPAVVEASQSRVPLIVLTADRPARLRGTGANQTIDQIDLYGKYARAFVDMPLPAEGAGATWRHAGVTLLERAVALPRGPVHANLPFEEPLSPSGDVVALDGPSPTSDIDRPDASSLAQTSEQEPTPADVKRLSSELIEAQSGIIVIGEQSGTGEGPTLLARRLGWPVLAEPTSGARWPGASLSAGQALISSHDWLDAHRPQLLLQLGASPTTRATQALVASSERLIVVDSIHLDPDPDQRAAWKLRTDGLATALQVIEQIGSEPVESEWTATWQRADAVARRAIDALIDAWSDPFEGRVARDLAESVPSPGTLAVGSSMPIRDLDYYMVPTKDLFVLANRGASGIDGFISTVLGRSVKDSEMGRPTFALCGDLTFLHDIGSLLWSAARGHDAVFVVVNNDGGAIFDFLPQRSLPEHERLFITPHGLDLAAICAAARAPHVRIARAADLVPAVRVAENAGGVHVIEVPSDRARNVERHAQVQIAVDEAIAAL